MNQDLSVPLVEGHFDIKLVVVGEQGCGQGVHPLTAQVYDVAPVGNVYVDGIVGGCPVSPMNGACMVTDREAELGRPVKVHPVDGDLSAERNRRACPNEGRQKGEEKEQQGDGLLHDFSFIGQSRGAVKGWGLCGDAVRLLVHSGSPRATPSR